MAGRDPSIGAPGSIDPDSAAAKERASRPSPRILVVEDDPSDLATVFAVLTESGYRVHPAPNAAFALRFLEQAAPDLILMDVGLPDQSGFQLCRTIKSRDEIAEIPVIFLSGADKLSDRMRAFSAGAVDYIVKPFETAEILARINTHVSLRALQLRLEERVQERTAELISANTRLRASEERYRRITESITDYVYTVRLEGGGRMTTIHGPGSVAVTGYTSEEFAADPELWIQMVVPDDRPMVVENTRRLLAGESFGPIEHRIVTKSGKERWVRNTPVPQYDEQGSLRAYDGLLQDITERRALQEQLLQAQKMESIGRLAGGIAHDFNNLLTAILGNAQLARADLPPGDRAREDIDEIVKAAERATSLTRQLLAFARKQIVEPVPLDIGAVVYESEQMLRRLVPEDVEIATILQPDLGLVEANPGQIHQLLVNLVVNAGDAMPDGGRLVIEARNTVLTAESAAAQRGLAAGRYAVLSVGDTGTGMTQEVMSHIFEPFFTTKEQGKGTGLGLATCHGIVKQIGGDIEVESELGVGTTFRILLPHTQRLAAARPAPTPHESLGRGGETILVVEDEASVRRLIVAALGANGYTVLEAADGSEALEILGSAGHRVDLMISDIVMPGMSGRHLVAELRDRFPTAKLLLTSGYLRGEMDEWKPGAAPIPFLAKPFELPVLIGKVRDILDGRAETSGDRTMGGIDTPTPDVHSHAAVDS
jgi:two-component system cell cycle sensor histidine kinase/response regulator CckA